LQDAYLGPDIHERDAYKALKRGEVRFAGLGREPTEGVGKDVLRAAEILAEGKVVARATGRMEWGPRALGNRSVLVRPHDPTVNVWLNEKLNRSEFMPFAPVVRAEDADRYFRGVDPGRTAAEFMTACFDCTDLFAEHCPAAVHVDGTARPQLVRKDVNPSLHACLTHVGELTGVPVLVNTSFNLHEEPIVCTASDAVRAFKQARLDALWLGPFVAELDSE
jgi:carbamoyltransferase